MEVVLVVRKVVVGWNVVVGTVIDVCCGVVDDAVWVVRVVVETMTVVVCRV